MSERDVGIGGGRAPSPASPSLPARYQTLELIGRGGMGEVWRAFDADLGRPVAIKTVRADLGADPRFRKRFERELAALAALSHPRLVKLLDGELGEGFSYYVMEFVEGRQLRELLAEGRFKPARAVDLAEQVADGLSALHAAGLVHRDVKAENVVVGPDGAVKLMDLGLVRDLGAAGRTALTEQGDLLGTFPYLPPEMVLGQPVDARADVYQVGLLLYELLTGERALDALAIMQWQLSRRVTAIPAPSLLASWVNADLDAVTLKAAAPDPAVRYRDCAELRDELRAWRAGRPLLATAAAPTAGGDRSAAGALPQAVTPTGFAPPAEQPVGGQQPHASPPRLRRRLLVSLACLAVLGAALECWRTGGAFGAAAPSLAGGAAGGASGDASGDASPLAVVALGSTSVLVTWSDAVGGSPRFALEAFSGGQAPRAVRPLRAIELETVASSSGFRSLALLQGLLPDTSYGVRLADAGGAAPTTRFHTTPLRPFELEVAVALGAASGAPGGDPLTVTVSSPLAFRATRRGLSFQRTYEVTLPFDEVQRRFPEPPTAQLTSLDGEGATVSLDPIELLSQALSRCAVEAADELGPDGLFLRLSRAEVRGDGPFARAERANTSAGMLGGRSRLGANLWREVEASLAADSAWYRRLSRMLPGLARLQARNGVYGLLRPELAGAFLPLEMLAASAERQRLPANPAWAPILGARRPFPLEVEHPRTLEASLASPLRRGQGPRCWTLIDPLHPRAGAPGIERRRSDWAVTLSLDVQEASAGVGDGRGAPRGGGDGPVVGGWLVVPVWAPHVGNVLVAVVDGLFTATLPIPDPAWREYAPWLVAGPKVAAVGVPRSAGWSDGRIVEPSQTDVMPCRLLDRPWLLRHPLPPARCSPGKHEVRLSVLAAPMAEVPVTVIDTPRIEAVRASYTQER